MKNIPSCKMILLMISFLYILPVNSLYSGRTYNNIEKGVYIPHEPVEAYNLRLLIVPASKIDYTFLQSIGEKTSIVIGKFSSGNKIITLIQDKNSDGKVDSVAHWHVSDGKLSVEKSPGKYISSEKFLSMKKDILTGKYDHSRLKNNSFNMVGNLIKISDNVSKFKNGYRVVNWDSDTPGKERALFFYSNNGINGNDLIIEIKYNYLGRNMVKPVIRWPVYCKGSKDRIIKEFVDKMTAETGKFFIKR